MTSDLALAEKIKQEAGGFGFALAEVDNADVVIVDCRAKKALGCAELFEKKVSLAIVNAGPGLSFDIFAKAADIIFYPFESQELFARLFLLAAKGSKLLAKETLSRGGFMIDFANYEVSIDGEKIDLTYKEYELLKCLASAPGRVFSRSQLLKNVWGYDYIEGARTVDVHIRRLRSKLGSKYSALIETVRHVGYRFSKSPP